MMHRPVLFLSLLTAATALAEPSRATIVQHADGFSSLRNGRPYFAKGAVGGVHLDELVAGGGNSTRAGVDILDQHMRWA